MPINLSHREVRDLAKNLRELTGREIKHTQIIDAIARAVGRSADSMMHELKNENVAPKTEPLDAHHMVLGIGFSDSPNGRKGRWVMTVLERRDPAPAMLEVVIEPTGDLRWLHLDPERPMWSVQVVHIGNAWGTNRIEQAVASAGSDGISLSNAISLAFEFIDARHHLWSKVDALEAEYDLHELNPLAASELRRRNTPQYYGFDSAYERARALGFDVLTDATDRSILMDQGPIRWNGVRYRLMIDNEDPSGLSGAPSGKPIWSLSMVFTDADGRQLRDPEQLISSATLHDVCAKTEKFRADPFGHSARVTKILNTPTNEGKKTMTPEDSKNIAKAAGFEIWDTGGGCTAFARLLREEPTPRGDVASMDLMITIEGGCSIDAAPDDRVWGAGINYTDPRGGESPLYTNNDLYTLEEAIAKAVEFEKQAERVWNENYDAQAIAELEESRKHPWS